MSIGRVTPSVPGRPDSRTTGSGDRPLAADVVAGSIPGRGFTSICCAAPIHFADDTDGAASSVVALGRRKRRAFLAKNECRT